MNSIHLFLVVSLSYCESYKILVVFPFPMKSHTILGDALVNLLLDGGDEVTYITHSPSKNSHPNLRQIVTKVTTDCWKGKFMFKTLPFSRSNQDIFNDMLNVSTATVTDPGVQELMGDADQTFDVAIVEWMINDLYSGFAAVFNCPFIWFFPMHHDMATSRLMHEPAPLTMAANIRTGNVPPLDFLQRVEEMLHSGWIGALRFFIYDHMELETYKMLYGPVIAKRGRSLPMYDDVRYNASLLLANTDITVRNRPVTALSFKAIGGFHIPVAPEPLSQELLDLLESSKNGVILFSLGSHLNADDMPSSMVKGLLEVFSKLKHTVFWKIDKQFDQLPSNVKTFPWLPQQSVLAHPKCVLFITHGGMLSMLETVHYGVPVIGVPVFGDQEVNVRSAVMRGFAKLVPLSYQVAADLGKAIEDVLGDPRFKERAMKLHAVYHDRPLPPGTELAHWVRHVARAGGAPLLRSPALLMPWYQKWCIDVAAALLVTAIGFVVVVKNFIACIIERLKRLKWKEIKKNV